MFDSLFDMLEEEKRLDNISDIASLLHCILLKIDQDQLKPGADKHKAIDAVIAILVQYKKFEKFQSRCS